jgi:hypothetical protein
MFVESDTVDDVSMKGKDRTPSSKKLPKENPATPSVVEGMTEEFDPVSNEDNITSKEVLESTEGASNSEDYPSEKMNRPKYSSI